jgi:hypothetical protein
MRTIRYDYAVGESLRSKQDVDLSVDEGVLSVPSGTVASIVEVGPTTLSLDLGSRLGGFTIDRAEVEKYFDRVPKNESLREANAVAVCPGRRVRVVRYDPNIGPNRGPGSPGHGGYETLVGQMGEIQTVFGDIKGIKTFKVNLEKGGQFVLGETELQVLESKTSEKPKLLEPDLHALRTVGYGF